jgi:paraquat-inducible protein A
MRLACPECDQLHATEISPLEGSLQCIRCGTEIRRCGRKGFPDRNLALALTSLLFFVLANAFPLLSLNLHGTIQTATLPGCVRILAAMGWPWLSAILLTTVELVPLAYLLGLITVLIQVRRGRATTRTARIFRRILDLQDWGMVEVFILGVLISYVKLSSMAIVLSGLSIYALAAYIFVAAITQSTLDPDAIWQSIRETP